MYIVYVCLHICECSVYVFAHLCVDIVCICVCVCIFVCMDVECVYVYAFTHAHVQRLVIDYWVLSLLALHTLLFFYFQRFTF